MRAKVVYASLWFAECIGASQYDLLLKNLRVENGIGEWIFASAYSRNPKAEDSSFLAAALQGESMLSMSSLLAGLGGPDEVRETILKIRKGAERFVDSAARRVLEMQPRIVGCSSSFQQNCASLALLRRIKQLDGSVITMMGGANCEAEMGLSIKRGFPWVDYVFSGEADETFPALCKRLLDGGAIGVDDVPFGVFSAANAESVHERFRRGDFASVPTSIVEDMGALPAPDFGDYFEQRNNYPDLGTESLFLPFEASRGCWKGERAQCLFCGLNGERRRYRSKPSEKVLAELQVAKKTYRLNTFFASDAIIDMAFFKTLLPALAETPEAYNLFFETVSTLEEHHLKDLAAAGVRWIQPGIETLDEEIVRLIDKGNAPLRSIALLKFAREQGIFVRWNILYRIPGDSEGPYRRMASLLPLLYHLQPPEIDGVEFHRFSRYEREPARYGLTLRPYPAYSYCYDAPEEIIRDLAFFFRSPEMDESRGYGWPAYMEIKRAIVTWTERYWGSFWRRTESRSAPILEIREDGDRSVITDTRECAIEPKVTLRGLEREIYRACRAPLDLGGILDHLGRSAADGGETEKILMELEARKLLISMSGKYLALANYPPVRPLPGKFPELAQADPTLWNWLSDLDDR